MVRKAIVVGSMLLVVACGRSERGRAPENTDQHVAQAPRPMGPAIDPRSSEAAEQIAGAFVALLNKGDFAGAWMLLGPGAPPRQQFTREFAEFRHLQVRAGQAQDQEGAAGSIYISVPLTISGEVDGKRADRSATAVLRRVNDVPGSTEAQRRWHIERIDWRDRS
jgi:hypothetical protein